MTNERTSQSNKVRVVRPHKRIVDGKVEKVKGYKQRYQAPRGPVKRLAIDKFKRKSQTMWLMDRHGKFIGRANAEGVTTAKGISRSGLDNTTLVRDAKKYKRIYGRVSQ